MQKKHTLRALSFLIFAAIVNTGCQNDPYQDEFLSNIYAQISIDLPNVDTLHFFNQNAQSGNHVRDYYINEKNAFRSFPYVDPFPFGQSSADGITFDLVQDARTFPSFWPGLWMPVTEGYWVNAVTLPWGGGWFKDVFNYDYSPDPFFLPYNMDTIVSAPLQMWELEPLEFDALNNPILPDVASGSQLINRYIGYNKVTKTLDFYELAFFEPRADAIEFDYQLEYMNSDPNGKTDQIWHLFTPMTLTKVDSITFKEHALWSRDGNPFLDKEKTWEIIEIRDSDGTLLNSSAYDCLYDNTFTFSAGNSLKLDIGLVHCASIDQPLLDNGVTEVFQQYTVVTDSITVSPYPYVYITTPGALFAPQRMFMISFDQETAELSTKYGTDSITLKVQAI